MKAARCPRWLRPIRHLILLAAGSVAWHGPVLAQTVYQQLAFFGPNQGLGLNPQTALSFGDSGTLYGISTAGTAFNFGAIFALESDATRHTLVRAFGSDTNVDGSFSAGGLVQGSDGALYGTTEGGGDFGIGCVFRLNPADRNFQVLYSIGSVTNDGQNVTAGVVFGKDDALYGTTEDGGAYRSGVLFKLNPDGSGYRILHPFGVTPTDGANPAAPMISGIDGALYGTTINGGASNMYAGTVFKQYPDGTGYTVLHSFSFGEGYNPRTPLIQGADGMLYGTTGYGGDYDGGIIYRLSTNGTGYQVVYSFRRTDGGNGGQAVLPSAVIQGIDGAFYGTTTYGGLTNTSATNGLGTVFRVDPSGSNYVVLHAFRGEDGRNPQAALLSGSDGVLYGTTPNGGYSDNGVVFKLAFTAPSRVVPIDLQVGGAGVLLTYSGGPGQTWHVQAATNLANPTAWSGLAAATTDTNGLFQFLDTSAVGRPARFYRAATP